MFSIGDSLKLFRMNAGLTQKQVADEFFVSDKTISAYENGRNEPDLITLQKMAKIFGTSLSKLIERSEILMQTKKTNFYLEAFEDVTFEGYTFGQHWNGWECPLFEKESGFKIMENWNKLEEMGWEKGYSAWFDEKNDTFYFKDPNHEGEFEPDAFKGRDIQFKGKTVHVYAIGSHSWTWDEEEE